MNEPNEVKDFILYSTALLTKMKFKHFLEVTAAATLTILAKLESVDACSNASMGNHFVASCKKVQKITNTNLLSSKADIFAHNEFITNENFTLGKFSVPQFLKATTLWFPAPLSPYFSTFLLG